MPVARATYPTTSVALSSAETFAGDRPSTATVLNAIQGRIDKQAADLGGQPLARVSLATATTGGHPGIIVEGGPGTGKSTVVAEAIRALHPSERTLVVDGSQDLERLLGPRGGLLGYGHGTNGLLDGGREVVIWDESHHIPADVAREVETLLGQDTVHVFIRNGDSGPLSSQTSGTAAGHPGQLPDWISRRMPPPAKTP